MKTTTSTVRFPAVTRVYSGRHGCACGCRGTYSDAPAAVTRVVNAMLAHAADVECTEGLDGEVVFFVETATRAYTAATTGGFSLRQL